MSKNLDFDTIKKALQKEALDENGFLSDLHSNGLEYDDEASGIYIQGDGYLDLDHLAELVEHLLHHGVPEDDRSA